MTFLNDLIVSNGWNWKKLLKAQDWSTLVIAFLLSAGCVMFFNYLQQSINSSLLVTSKSVNLHQYEIFDRQLFYSPERVKNTLDGWGNDGIQIYYLIEIVDVIVFCSAYRLLFVGAVNILLDKAKKSLSVNSFDKLQCVILLPLIVTFFDYTEDVAQVTMCFLYQKLRAHETNSFLWASVVFIASSFNFLKWLAVIVSLMCFLCLTIFVLYKSFTSKGENKFN